MHMLDECKQLRWLVDHRKLKVIRQADQEWFMGYALRLIQAGPIRRNAMIVSEDNFNKMALEQILKRSGDSGSMLLQNLITNNMPTWLNNLYCLNLSNNTISHKHYSIGKQVQAFPWIFLANLWRILNTIWYYIFLQNSN